MPRVLGANQRKRYNRIRKNRGQEAAAGYKSGIAARQPETGGPATEPPPADPPPADAPADPPPAAEPPPAEEFQDQGQFQAEGSNYNDPSGFQGSQGTAQFGPGSVEDIQASPDFQWRQQQGQKALDRQLAAGGMNKSGAAIAKSVGMTQNLTGEETARREDRARFDANRYDQNQLRTDRNSQFDAQRYDAMREGNLNREERGSDRQWGRVTDMLNYYNAQNPMQYSMAGMGGYANTQGQMGKNQGNYIRNRYRRFTGAPGGGGGQPMPQYMPPMPPGPDQSVSDMIRYGGGSYDGTRGGVQGLLGY